MTSRKALSGLASAAMLIAMGSATPAFADPLLTYDGTTTTTFDGASVVFTPGGSFGGTANAGAWNALGWTGAILKNNTTGLSEFALSNLPSHSFISLDFLLAFTESWDSTNGSPAPDYLFIFIDGVEVAKLTSNNASGTVQDFGGGTLLYFRDQLDLDFSYSDVLVDMSTAGFAAFAHSGPTLTLGFRAGGAGWQSDEAWAIDALRIDYRPTAPIPEPASWAMMIGGMAIVGSTLRRQRTRIQFG